MSDIGSYPPALCKCENKGMTSIQAKKESTYTWMSENLRHSNIGHRAAKAVSNLSGYRCAADCRSRGRELDPGVVRFFRGD